MTYVRSDLMYKGDELFVLTVIKNSGVEVFTFTSGEDASKEFDFLSDASEVLGIKHIYFTNSFLNVNLQEESLMGEIH